MSDSIPHPEAETVLQPEVVFRTLTPVFNFGMDAANQFSHCGNYGSARFSVRLRPFANTMSDFMEITEYASDPVRQMLLDRHIHLDDYVGPPAQHMLTNDVIHERGSVPDNCGASLERGLVEVAALEALRLHSSAGLPYIHSSYFRYPQTVGGLGIGRPHFPQWQFSHVAYPSVLRRCDYVACRNTIDTLLVRQRKNVSTFDKVLLLALNYHRISFSLEDVAHAFLLSLKGAPTRVSTDRQYLRRALRLGFTELQVTKADAAVCRRDRSRCYLWVPLDPATTMPAGAVLLVEPFGRPPLRFLGWLLTK